MSDARIALARKYVRKIRNVRKQAYAAAYLDWMLADYPPFTEPCAECGCMAAQAVRMQLCGIMDGDVAKREARERVRAMRGALDY